MLTLEQARATRTRRSRVAREAPAARSPASAAAHPQPSPASGQSGTSPPPRVDLPSPCGERRRRGAPVDDDAFKAAHASPSVRKFARELGVDLAQGDGHRAERPHPAGGRAGAS